MTDIDWNKLSPAALWREWIVKSEAQWSEAVSQLLKDEKTGGVLNRQLDELRMLHRMLSEGAQASLAALNLPSRNDLEALDERLGRVEDGLAQVASELALLRQALVTSAAANSPTPRPARTRKPPVKATAAEAAPAPGQPAPRTAAGTRKPRAKAAAQR